MSGYPAALPSLRDCVNDVCPATGRPVSGDALALYKGRVVGFADKATRDLVMGAFVALETAIRPAPCVKAA